jgi:hypothetical protein
MDQQIDKLIAERKSEIHGIDWNDYERVGFIQKQALKGYYKLIGPYLEAFDEARKKEAYPLFLEELIKKLVAEISTCEVLITCLDYEIANS